MRMIVVRKVVGNSLAPLLVQDVTQSALMTWARVLAVVVIVDYYINYKTTSVITL